MYEKAFSGQRRGCRKAGKEKECSFIIVLYRAKHVMTEQVSLSLPPPSQPETSSGLQCTHDWLLSTSPCLGTAVLNKAVFMNCNILFSHRHLENFGLLRVMQGKGSFNIVRGQAKRLVLDLPVSVCVCERETDRQTDRQGGKIEGERDGFLPSLFCISKVG